MSSPTQTRPVATLHPSSQEDVNAYMAAIRLASTVRNNMDAPKADVDTKEAAVDADSYGRHHHKFPPTPANLTTPGRHETVPILNETSPAHSASDTTTAGLVRPQDSEPSSRRSMSIVDTPTGATLEARKPHHGYFPPPDPPTSNGDSSIPKDTAANTPTDTTLETRKLYHGFFSPPDPPTSNGDSPILKDTAADTPTDATLEARKPHHGYFPPPDPPIGSTPAPPEKPKSRRTGPIPITNHHGPNGIKWYGPGDIPPQPQLYATNTETNNDTVAVRPGTSNTTHTLTSHHQLHTSDTFNPHISLATRATATCEAPTTGFKQQLACGNLDGWFALAFFILFWIIGLAWVIRRKYNARKPDDEEIGSATSPRLLHASTNNSPGAKAKPRASSSNVSTNSSSEDKLREELCRAACEELEEQRLNKRLGTKQYENAAWRSASRRAARANGEGKVGRDAGRVAVLPDSFAGELHAYPFERLPPSL